MNISEMKISTFWKGEVGVKAVCQDGDKTYQVSLYIRSSKLRDCSCSVSYTHLDVYKRQVPGPGSFCGFLCREKEYIIPFCRICQVGEDIILVDYEEKEERCKGG